MTTLDFSKYACPLPISIEIHTLDGSTFIVRDITVRELIRFEQFLDNKVIRIFDNKIIIKRERMRIGSMYIMADHISHYTVISEKDIPHNEWDFEFRVGG